MILNVAAPCGAAGVLIKTCKDGNQMEVLHIDVVIMCIYEQSKE